MRIRINLSVYLFVLLPLFLQAQLSDAHKALEADDCLQAAQLFQQAGKKEKDAIAAYTGLALVLSKEDCDNYDLDEAYNATAKAYQLYRKLDRKSKDRLEGKNFAKRDLLRLRKNLCLHFLEEAKQQQNPKAIDLYLDRFDIATRKIQEEARFYRDSLAIAMVQSAGKVEDFINLEEQYGASIRSKPELNKLLNLAEILVWTQENGFDQQEEMTKLFPANRDSRDKSIAFFGTTLEEDRETSYGYFLKLYPKSPLKGIAEDSLRSKMNRRIATEQKRDALIRILADEKLSDQWKQADQDLAQLMLDQRFVQGSKKQLARIPAERGEATFTAVYLPYQKANSLEAIRIFQERFSMYRDRPKILADIKSIEEAIRQEQIQTVDSLLAYLQEDQSTNEYKKGLSALDKSVRKLEDQDRASAKEKWSQLDETYKSKRNDVADRYLTARYNLLAENERWQWEKDLAKGSYQDYPLLSQKCYERYLSLENIDSLRLFAKTFPQSASTKKVEADVKRLIGLQSQNLVGLQKKIKPLLKERNWEKALEEVKAAESKLGKNKFYQELVHILSREEPNAPRKLLGDLSVNTGLDEYTPVLSADGRTLYFCRQDGYEAIHAAQLKDDKLIDGGPIPAFIDKSENVAPLSLTVDGNRLLLFKGGDMYYSDRTKDGWSKPIRYPEAINGGNWQGMGTLTPDGSAMIFEARGRKGMQGNSFNNIDLFISFRAPDGSWQEAKRIGDIINTKKRERSPYLHPDTRTLYFSTDGRSGLGGLDVYKTTRLDDSWLNWSEPVHLGRSANTVGDDWGYKITTDGRYAYFAGDPDGDDFDDIYKVEIPVEARPQPVTLFSAFLFNADQEPIEVELMVEDLETGEIVAKLRSEPGSGRITATLPNDKQYGLVFEDGKRLPFADNLDLRDVDSSQVVETTIEMKTVEETIEAGEALPLRNVFFDLDQAILKPASLSELKRVAELILSNPQLKVQVNGHTDNSGTPSHNLDLSKRRAEAVRSKLIELGIQASQIQAKGFGENQPVASNDTETGRAKNRRVEIVFN